MSKSLRLGKLESFERVSNVGSKASWLGRSIPNKSSSFDDEEYPKGIISALFCILHRIQ